MAKQTSGTMLDAVEVSDLEEVSDQDTDNNVVECKESFVCCILKMYSYMQLKVFSSLLVNGE